MCYNIRICSKNKYKNVRSYVLSIIGIIVFIFSPGVAFAESGSGIDYQLEIEQNGHRGDSSSYNLCGTLLSTGVLGSSSGYNIYPSLPCREVDTPPIPTCGNGMINDGEQCDGANLGGMSTCADIGHNTGTLSCDSSCQYTGCSTMTYGGSGGGGGVVGRPAPLSRYVAPEEPKPVTDIRDPLHPAYAETEVDGEESVLEPDTETPEEYLSEDRDFKDKLFVPADSQPVIKEERIENLAMIGAYFLKDGTIRIVEGDKDSEVESILPKLLGYEAGEYRIVALYEDEFLQEYKLLKEDRLLREGELHQSGASQIEVNLPIWVCILLLIPSALSLVIITLFFCRRQGRGARRKPRSKNSIARRGFFGLFVLLLSLMIIGSSSVFAADVTPSFMVYNGILKDSDGNPITTAKTFRFSLWTSDDFVSLNDLTGAGAINTGSASYASWKEFQTITPDSNGYFEIRVGITSGDPWPNFHDMQYPYLQVEIKNSIDSDSLYQRIFPDGADSTDDRFDIGSEPFARNSDYLDNKEIGTSTGDIVILGADNVFPTSVIPAGTDTNSWSIDSDDSATEKITLSFGSLLSNHVLEWDPDGVAVGDGWFNFNDDVNIQGNLTVTGNIDIPNLQFTDIQPRAKVIQLIPEFANTTIDQLGAGTHRGKLEGFFDDTDGPGAPNNMSHYMWTSRQATIEDISLVVRWRVPDDFTSWQANPVVLQYKTDTALAADNRIDVLIDDTTGTNIAGLTDGSSLVNTSYTTTNIGFGGEGTFTAGSEITIYIKMSATSAGGAYVGDISFNYNGR